jgi:PEP-CTERM motif
VPGTTCLIEPGTTDTVSDKVTFDPDKKLSFTDSDKIFDDPEDKGVLPKEPRTFDHDVDGCCGFLPVGAKGTPEGQFSYKGQTYEAVDFALLSSDPGFDTERSSPVTYLFVGDLAVPEPASIVLLGMGIALLAAYRRRN